MRISPLRNPLRWPRRLALTGIVLLGLVTIVGSGGGSDGPQCSFFSDVCNPIVEPPGALPIAQVFPRRATVRVGGAVELQVQVVGIVRPTYQWRRSFDGGRSFVDIGGATGTSYTLANVQLQDDGAQFLVSVQGSASAVAAPARVAVSSMPGVVFQQGDFPLADWAVTSVADPALNGPTHTEAQATLGGNPGGFRSLVHVMSPGPSALRVLHALPLASYDPALQGAIYVIDYTEDCIRPTSNPSSLVLDSGLLLEQAGRRYTTAATSYCASAQWFTMAPSTSLAAADFVLLDGPACGVGESCPDFAFTAAPLRFGFVRHSALAAGQSAVSIEHGIDNWKATVWRR